MWLDLEGGVCVARLGLPSRGQYHTLGEHEMGVRDRYATGRDREDDSIIDRFLHLTRDVEPELWIALLTVMALDVVLTMYGLEIGLREGNPIARAAIERFGVFGLVWLKGLSMTIAVIGWARIERRFQGLVPLGITLVWGFAVTVNATLILTVP